MLVKVKLAELEWVPEKCSTWYEFFVLIKFLSIEEKKTLKLYFSWFKHLVELYIVVTHIIDPIKKVRLLKHLALCALE